MFILKFEEVVVNIRIERKSDIFACICFLSPPMSLL